MTRLKSSALKQDNRLKPLRLPCPTESEEQIALFEWSNYNLKKYPELDLMYHIPNGSYRAYITAARLKKEGVRAGVPDICLPVSRSGYHGLYIELKRIKGGATTVSQDDWLYKLTLQGYKAVVCFGWVKASEMIVDYLEGRL